MKAEEKTNQSAEKVVVDEMVEHIFKQT